MRTRHGLAAATLTALAAAALLAGCGGGGGGSTDKTSVSVPRAAAGGSANASASARGDSKAASGQLATGDESSDGGASSTSARVLPPGRDIVYRGQLSVRVKDVNAAAARAESYATSVDGLVFAEETTTDTGPGGASTATLTLRVPPTQFRPLLDRLGRLGKQLSRSQTAEDVTTQAVDLESRLSSQRRSVARIRALLDRATTIGQIVQVEGELARREADLESLEAQQKKLKDLTDLATIELSLTSPGTRPAVVRKTTDLGFLSGLRDGWNAVAAVLLVTVTAVGAALPFVILLALVGIPAWFLVRRRNAPAAAAPPPTTP
ncbi:MAG: DUF4349 domain-containing protein [Actinomycetes bacterium]